MNTQTAIIDGSVNYGTSEETIKRLRTFTEGLLKTGVSNTRSTRMFKDL